MNPPQGSPPSIPVNRFGSDPSVGQQGANKRGRNQSQNSDMGGDRDRRRLGELSSTQPSNVAAMAAAVAAAASAAAGGAPQSPAGTGVGQGQNQGQGQHQNNSSSNWPFAIPSLPLNPGFPNSPQQQQQQQSQQQQAAAAAAAAQQQQQQQQNYAFAAAFANVIASRSDPMLPFPGPPRTAQTPSTASSSGTNSQQQQSHQAPSTTTDSDLLGKPQRGIGAAPALMDLVGRLRNILQSYRGESSADEARRTIVDFREAADSTSDTASSAAGFAPDSTGADRNWDGGVFEFLLQHTGALDFLQSQGSRDGLQRIVDRMDALFAPTDTLVTDPTGAVDLTTAWDPEMDTASSMGWSAGDNNAGGAPISGGTATAAAMAAAVAAASANPAARMQMQAQLQFMQMQQQQQQQQSNYGQHPGGGPMASSLAPSLRSGPMGPVPSHLGPAHQRMASGGSVPGNPGFPTFRHPSQPAQQQQQQQGGGQQGGQGQMTSPQTQVPMHQRSQFPHPQGQQALPHPRYPTQQQQGQQQQQQQQQGQQQGQQQFLHSPSAPQSAQQQYGNHLINALRSASQGQAASVNPQMLTGEGTFSPSQNPGGPGILFESPNSNASSNMDPNALHGQNTQGFFPRTLAGSSNASSQSGSNNSRSENTKGSSAQRTGSGSGSGSGSDPTTLNNAPGVLPPSSNKLREPLSATLTEESIHALTTVLKAVGPNVPGGMQARQYQPLVNALSQLSVRLRSTGDDYFLEPLLGQVGWDEGISAKDFVEYWASMCSSLREQQREQKASKVPARQSKGKQKEDAMSVESGDEEEETERGRSRGVEEESGRVTRQAKSAGGTGTQSGDSKKQQGGVKQDPAEAALQESSFGLLALALSLMPRAEDDKKEDGKRRSGNSSAAQGGDEWKTKVNDFVASAPSRSDPVFQGMLANANNVLGANASIEAFIQHLAGFIGQRLPRAYRAVKKAVVSLWLFLRELKTNNAGLDARKVDNMVGLWKSAGVRLSPVACPNSSHLSPTDPRPALLPRYSPTKPPARLFRHRLQELPHVASLQRHGNLLWNRRASRHRGLLCRHGPSLCRSRELYLLRPRRGRRRTRKRRQ